MSLFCAMRRYFIIFFFSPTECVDISQKQCPLWAANNQCIDNPCYMHKHCAKSCLCGKSGLPFCLLFAFNFFCFCYCTDYSSLRKELERHCFAYCGLAVLSNKSYSLSKSPRAEEFKSFFNVFVSQDVRTIMNVAVHGLRGLESARKTT